MKGRSLGFLITLAAVEGAALAFLTSLALVEFVEVRWPNLPIGI